MKMDDSVVPPANSGQFFFCVDVPLLIILNTVQVLRRCSGSCATCLDSGRCQISISARFYLVLLI